MDAALRNRTMLPPPRFLVVDFHPESRFLLVRTLQRKFPGSICSECDDAEAAVDQIRRGNISAVIIHRTFDVTGIDLIRLFRNAGGRIPLVMVSGIDRRDAALAAGADRFLPYDEWLRIGTLVEELLAGSLAPFATDAENLA